MRSLYLCLLFSVTILFAACGWATSESQVAGCYEADYSLAHEELVLYPDGTFTQRVTLNQSGKVDVARGTWALERKPAGMVSFDRNFMHVKSFNRGLNPAYAQGSNGFTALPAEFFFGQHYLGNDKDILYKRVRLR